MTVYAVDKLMSETRRLAAAFYEQTQQVLPVSAELAKYDAMRLLTLSEPKSAAKGVDCIDQDNSRYQVKSRVIFQEGKPGLRVGQLNLEGEWDHTLLVLLDPSYEPFEIYQLDKPTIESQINQTRGNKRGAMTIAKFKALGELVWTAA